jgi:hypothetical protein
MRSSLFARLTAWTNLMCARPDVETVRPFEVRAESDLEPQWVSALPYPEDAAELARSAKRMSVSFLGPQDEEERAAGSFSLSLEGCKEGAHLVLDDAVVDPDSMVLFDVDEDGTGQSGWYVHRADRPPCILWDVETKVQFASLTEYVTEGAKRAFAAQWQCHGVSPLVHCSMQPATLDELKAALVARGADPAIAADLVEWLGFDARLLVPASADERKRRKKTSALAERARKGGKKAVDLWTQVLAAGVYGAQLFEAWNELLMGQQSASSWERLREECARALAGPDARKGVPRTLADHTRPFFDRLAWPGDSVHAVAHLRLAIALEKLGQLDAALGSVAQASALGASGAHWQRACILVRKNLLDEALEAAIAEVNDDSDSLEGMLEDSDLGPIHERLSQKAAEEA